MPIGSSRERDRTSRATLVDVELAVDKKVLKAASGDKTACRIALVEGALKYPAHLNPRRAGSVSAEHLSSGCVGPGHEGSSKCGRICIPREVRRNGRYRGVGLLDHLQPWQWGCSGNRDRFLHISTLVLAN